MAVYGRQRPAQTLVRTAVSARSMVRMGSPVRFRRGARPKTAGQARSCTQPVAYRELRTAICQRIASPICTLCVGARRLPMPLRGDHRQPAPRVTPEAVEHPVLLPGRPAGRRRRRPGQGRAVGVRSVVITSDSASSPASTRSAAASKQAAESRRPGTASRGGAGSADAGGQGGATVEDPGCGTVQPNTTPVASDTGSPRSAGARAVTSTARSMLELRQRALPAGERRRPAETNRDAGITEGHGFAPVPARLTVSQIARCVRHRRRQSSAPRPRCWSATCAWRRRSAGVGMGRLPAICWRRA